MSHLACAEIADHPLNARQIAAASASCACFTTASPPRLPIPPASSSAKRRISIWRGPAPRSTASTRHRVSATRCSAVVELTGPHPADPQYRAGETVGYGATWTRQARVAHRRGRARLCRWTAARRERRRPPPGGAAIIAGKRCPFAGRISMDLLCVDITDLADGAARRGDSATPHRPRSSRSTKSPHRPAPSATRFSPGSGRVAIVVYRGG